LMIASNTLKTKEIIGLGCLTHFQQISAISWWSVSMVEKNFIT
jgi:hypothetical protein